MRQRLAAIYIEHTLLELIRLRTLTARFKGEQPGPEASVRKILADEHGQHVMAAARDLVGAWAMRHRRRRLAGDPCRPDPKGSTAAT